MNKTLATSIAFLSPQMNKLQNYDPIFSKLIIGIVSDHLVKPDSERQDSVNSLSLR